MNGSIPVRAIVNGAACAFSVGAGEAAVDAIRHRLGLTGTKLACGQGVCGACSAMVDGVVVNTCLLPATSLEGRTVRTIGTRVTPDIANGYATIVRTWKAGDRIELELPMKVQRVYASEKIEANRGRVALRYGPLVYNIERVDQDIAAALASTAPLATEWRPGLLNGVTVITGKFADGTPLLAIPNYARYNRNPPAPPYVPPPPATPGQPAAPRPPLPPPESIVWIRER